MSILTYRKPRVHRNTRPAVIRPVPATFGQGIIDGDSAPMPAGLARVLARRQSETARALPPISEALEVRKTRNTINPGGIRAARAFGYRLGRQGREEVNPAVVYNRHERAAFVEGHEEGLDEYHRMEIAMYELQFAEMEREGWGHDMPWGDDAEYNLAGGLVGYMD